MYRGFVLKLDLDSVVNKNEDLIERFKVKNSVKQEVEKDLKEYLDTANRLDGTKIQKDWFPEVKAHVFISHAHQDEKLAIYLAYLLRKIGIISFIDSFVWGYADKLLKRIDNKYCKNEVTGSYVYKMRNYSTSHVHMMLATALTKMIDKTECLLFLYSPKSIANTPKSVVKDGKIDKTYSPWIYHEIATTKIIQKTKPVRIEKSINSITDKHLREAENKEILQIMNDVDFNHLTILDTQAIFKWLKGKFETPYAALDKLYSLENSKSVLND